MNSVRVLNLGLRFILELCAIVALAYGGFAVVSARWQQVALAVVLPAAGAVLWGLFVSPKAKVSANWVVRLAVEIAVFGAAAALLYSNGQHRLAITFLVVAAISRAVKAWYDARERIAVGDGRRILS